MRRKKCERYIPGVAYDRVCNRILGGGYEWQEKLIRSNISENYVSAEADKLLKVHADVIGMHGMVKVIAPSVKEGTYLWEGINTPFLAVDIINAAPSQVKADSLYELGNSLKSIHALTGANGQLPVRDKSIVECTDSCRRAFAWAKNVSILNTHCFSNKGSIIHGRFSLSMMLLLPRGPILLLSHDLGCGDPMLDVSHIMSELWELYCKHRGNRLEQDSTLRCAKKFLTGYYGVAYSESMPIEELMSACRFRSSIHVLLLSYIKNKSDILTKYLEMLDSSEFFQRLRKEGEL